MFHDIRTAGAWTSADNTALARRRNAGDPEAINALATVNLPLVVLIAKQFQGRGLELEDLISEGSIGLIRAAELFDPERDIKFATYAKYWIKQTIRLALINQTRTIRLPAYIYDLISRYRKAGGVVPATVEEVMDRIGVSRKKAKCLVDALDLTELCRRRDSDPDGDGDLAAMLCVCEDDPAASMAAAESSEAIQRAIDTLPAHEAVVVRRFFGLDGQPRETLREIGGRLGYCHVGSVHHLLKQSLKHLDGQLSPGFSP